ncbi:hypothetical protein [Nocardiopsis synnemataformans]|uniref:hypothetical protein n=1 Tax=Nocardiopsis synnemataformans TaxID=61305 RepID=UPI003EBD8557
MSCTAPSSMTLRRPGDPGRLLVPAPGPRQHRVAKDADQAQFDGVYDVVNSFAHAEDAEELDRWWDDLDYHDWVYIRTR